MKKLRVISDFNCSVHLSCHIVHKHNYYLYRFEIPVCVSLAVHVGHRWHNLPEKHSGLLLWQPVLCDNVVKQLSTWAVLRQGKEENYLLEKKSILSYTYSLCTVGALTSSTINICEEVSMTWYNRQTCWWLRFFIASISNFTRGKSSCE